MTEVLIGILLLAAANLLLTARVLVRLTRGDAEAESEQAVQDAMDEEKRERGSLDEGFENIMRYAVNGKTGFDDE